MQPGGHNYSTGYQHDSDSYGTAKGCLRSGKASISWNAIITDSGDSSDIIVLTSQERELEVRRHDVSTQEGSFCSFLMILEVCNDQVFATQVNVGR